MKNVDVELWELRYGAYGVENRPDLMLIGRGGEGAKSSLRPETDKLPAALTDMRLRGPPHRLGRRAFTIIGPTST